MKSKISFIICLVLLSFVGGTFCSAGSEDTQKSGGKCNYKSYPGLFKVNEIVKTKIGPVSDSVEVTVKGVFTPDDLSVKSKYKFPNFEDKNGHIIFGAMKKDGSDTHFKSIGIEKGKGKRAVRMEIESGTCTPVVFSFE